MITFGLLWHSLTSDNLGVRAMTEAHMELLARVARRLGAVAEYVIVGTQGGGRQGGHNDAGRVRAEVTFQLRRRPFEMARRCTSLVRLLQTCDVLLDIGEGDSFSDIYGNRRLATLAATRVLGRLSRTPLIIAPQTVGPFASRTGRLLSSLGQRGAFRAYGRDPGSTTLLARSMDPERVSWVTDVAFGLRPEPGPTVTRRGVKIAGVNVSGLLAKQAAGGRIMGTRVQLAVDYLALMRGICEHLRSRCFEVVLVSHVETGGDEDDREAAERLLESGIPARMVAPFSTPGEAKAFIGALDLLVASRMHAAVAAVSQGVPVVNLAYSPKSGRLFEPLGYPGIVDCRERTIAGCLAEIDSMIDRRAVLAECADLAARTAVNHLRRYEDDLVEVVGAQARRRVAS